MLRPLSDDKGNQFKSIGVLEYKKCIVTFDEMLRMLCVSNSATVTPNGKQITKKKGQNFDSDLYMTKSQKAARGNWVSREFKYP